MQDRHHMLTFRGSLHTTSIGPYDLWIEGRSECSKANIKFKEKTRRKRRVFIRSAMRGAEAAFSKLPS
jgi:hypothetical protein